MTNERLILAIGQMERALSRIESAQVRLGQHAQSDMVTRHDQLKTAAAEALAGIDAVLAGKG